MKIDLDNYKDVELGEMECPKCGRVSKVAIRRLPTHYVDEKDNYLTSCEACYKEVYGYYEEMRTDTELIALGRY